MCRCSLFANYYVCICVFNTPPVIPCISVSQGLTLRLAERKSSINQMSKIHLTITSNLLCCSVPQPVTFTYTRVKPIYARVRTLKRVALTVNLMAILRNSMTIRLSKVLLFYLFIFFFFNSPFRGIDVSCETRMVAEVIPP